MVLYFSVQAFKSFRIYFKNRLCCAVYYTFLSSFHSHVKKKRGKYRARCPSKTIIRSPFGIAGRTIGKLVG